jgi:hypothetical protein
MIGREDHGDEVIAHEFDYSVPKQVIYSRNGVNITSTPVQHYTTAGPVALRLDWNGLSVTYSGTHKRPAPNPLKTLTFSTSPVAPGLERPFCHLLSHCPLCRIPDNYSKPGLTVRNLGI